MEHSTFWGYVDSAIHAQFSLQFVIWTSIGLFWIVVFLSVFMLCFRGYYYLRRRYEKSRKALYEPAVEQVLMEAPLEEILNTLRPKRWGDRLIVQGVILEAMRHLTGPPFLTFKYAAERLGFIERNIKDLDAANPHRRGMAIEALGIMRCTEAIGKLQELLLHERMNLKLVALRSLTAIGDPAVLPSFVAASDFLQPAVLIRLASLIMEFGPIGRPTIVELVNRHPEGFHPRALAELLKELASDMEANP